MNSVLWIFTGVLLLFSLLKDAGRTGQALVLAWRKFWTFSSAFALALAGFALFVTLLPPEWIRSVVGADSGLGGVLLAMGLGGVSVMPGFAVFPLCAALRGAGVPLHILAGFSVSLMTVGVLTFPLERQYLGLGVALVRNVLALLITALTVGVFWGVFGA